MDTSLQLRHSIIALLNTGNYSQRQIARQLRLAQSTVNDIIRHYERTGELEPGRFGRPATNRCLTTRDERHLTIASQLDPLATARQLRDRIGGSFANVSVRTVQRSLRRSGRLSYRPTASP